MGLEVSGKQRIEIKALCQLTSTHIEDNRLKRHPKLRAALDKLI
ncbi:hypothetical protein MED121_00665 [Marinomonas sp. MED121]|nr:hypothetical protein [Marinomonas sp. MED121]EAQ63675.1 hypothetical protein MED121_00665 [Marinomonas sp. MED121]